MESVIKQLISKVPPPDWTWAVSAIIALVTFYFARFLYVVRQYPKGPFPWPVVGNLLLLKNNKPLFELAPHWAKKYGDPVTVWIGSKPFVIVNSWEHAKEGNLIKRNDFAGRIRTKAGDLQQEANHDIIFNDYGPSWETLRKVAHKAVRKYAVSEELEKLSAEVTEEYLSTIKDGQEVILKDVMFNIINNIIAETAFGKKFPAGDPDLEVLRNVGEKIDEIAPNGLPSDTLPLLAILYWRLEKKVEKILADFRAVIRKNYNTAKSKHNPGVMKNFTDAVLVAKEEAVAEEKESADHFTEGNMVQIMQDLFGAGTDTSFNTLTWAFMFISNEPHHQEKIYKEIMENIGNRYPTNTDRKKLPYTIACIYETLRLRPIAPLGLPHKAIFDSEIDGVKIPKGTGVFFNIQAINTDPMYWKEPLKYKPERWLDQDGNFTNQRLQSFMPFGIGRRSCLGEKMAMADMFYVMVRLLQFRKFSLSKGPGSANFDNSNSAILSKAKSHKVIITKRN